MTHTELRAKLRESALGAPDNGYAAPRVFITSCDMLTVLDLLDRYEDELRKLGRIKVRKVDPPGFEMRVVAWCCPKCGNEQEVSGCTTRPPRLNKPERVLITGNNLVPYPSGYRHPEPRILNGYSRPKGTYE